MEWLHLAQAESIAFVVLGALLLTLGASGNGVLLYLFGWKLRGRRSRYEVQYLVINAADALLCLIIPFLLVARFGFAGKQVNKYQVASCMISMEFTSVNLIICQTALLSCSVEHFRIVCKATSKALPRSVWISCIVTSVILGSLLYLPIAASGNYPCAASLDLAAVRHSSINLCLASITMSKDFLATGCIGTIIARTYSTIREREAFLRNKEIYSQAKIGAFSRRLLIILVFIYMVCTLPLSVFNFALSFKLYKAETDGQLRSIGKLAPILPFLVFLSAARAALFPLVYLKLHPRAKEIIANAYLFLSGSPRYRPLSNDQWKDESQCIQMKENGNESTPYGST